MPRINAASIAEHRTLTMERLLDAWGELLGERGYAELTLADVAARAGIARTAVYNYVPDKETLLMAYLDREVQRSVDGLRVVLDEAPDPAAKVAAFVRYQIGYLARTPATAQDLDTALQAEQHARFQAHVAPVAALLDAVLADGIAAGAFVAGDVVVLRDLVHGAVWGQRMELARGERDPEAAAALTVPFVLRGLGVAIEPPARPVVRRGR